MKTKYKYIKFEQTTLSNIWNCINIKYKEILGIVRYSPAWHCFIFQPEECCDFSADCLADIIDFMKQLEKPK